MSSAGVNMNDSSWVPSLTYSITTLTTSLMIAIFSPVAVVGNSLIVAAIWKSPSLRTPSFILIGGLAVTDLGIGLFIQPLYVDFKLNELNTETRPGFYLAGPVVGALVAYCGSLRVVLMAFMAMERWFHMSRRSFITVLRAHIINGFSMVLPVPVAVLRLTNHSSFTVDVIEIFIIVLCIVITTFAYFKVWRIIRHHQQQIHASQVSNNLAQPSINLAKYKRSVISLLYIIASFYLSYLPTVCCVILIAVGREFSEILYSVSYVSLVVFYLSFSFNPVLYCWRIADMRNGVREVVNKIFCNALNQQ